MSIYVKLNVKHSHREGGPRSTAIVAVIAHNMEEAKNAYYENCTGCYEVSVEGIADFRIATPEDFKNPAVLNHHKL